MERKDPIGQEYYVPLAKAERLSDIIFYVSAALSVLLLLVARENHTTIYSIAQATFIVTVVIAFLLGVVIKLYFSARAQASRSADFVSSAFAVPLVPFPSQGYYNPPTGDPFLRIGSSVLENTLFTKNILHSMLKFERGRVCVYALAWLWALSYRSTNLDLLAIAAQVVFSEQILSRWARMEWLRARVERIHDDLYALFQSTSNVIGKEFKARVMEALIGYETGKAQAGISLSSGTFRRLNPRLSSEWEAISRQVVMRRADDPTG